MIPKEYNEGHAAFFDGLTDADCPYAIGSDEAMYWNDGFNDAQNEGK